MERSGGKFLLQWDSHPRQTSKGLCMLMERQCLVDIAICCGSNTMHAHKCILAANSSYFKDHFENKTIEQVIVNGIDFSVIKAIIEFLYCGECVVAEEHLKYLIAAVRLFKIPALESIFAENEYQNISADEVCMPTLQFISKPPKYPTIYKPFSNAPLPPKINYAVSNGYNHHKFKRKCFGTEAEKACAKEAQASRIALANLRKVMATTPQVHSFIVEESFNETTVENFIPTVEENCVDTLNDIQFVDAGQTKSTSSIIPVPLTTENQELTANKIKNILGNDEVEIMFQTSDGSFVNVSDEVLLNLSKGALQYQVVDENGHVGELQEFSTLDSDKDRENNSLKTEKGFDDKMTKSGVDIEKMDYEAFPNSNKTTLEPLGFGEGIFENSYMQSSDIFEPENLSMHSDFVDAPDKLKFIIDANQEIIDLTSESVDKSTGRGDILNSGSPDNKTALKFSADMFFADNVDSIKTSS